jgi:histidinol dehydrogenase
MRIFERDSTEATAALRDIVARRNESNENAMLVAREAIAGVRAGGDVFVASQIARFDRVELAPGAICIEPENVTLDAEMARAIDTAIERVEAFHREQLPHGYTWSRHGSSIEHRVRPLRRAGVYAPGGRAVYVSTLIMGAVPARIAGVRELVVCTTPAAAERPELHYVCRQLGVTEIYRSGGAAGIAALALGTSTLQRVDKIVGPGNQYVTAAKALLVGTVGIDMTAGPTELVVLADETSDMRLVAADILAQAEHGDDSSVIGVTTSRETADALSHEVETQLAAAPADSAAHRSLAANSLVLIVDSTDAMLAVANEIAPEHLSIHTADARALAERADNCGAIFCGPYSPVAAGDYIAGPNHVLPTAGSARFFSPLGVYDFVKRSNVISLSRDDMQQLAPMAERLANFEGLPLHGRSVAMRAK